MPDCNTHPLLLPPCRTCDKDCLDRRDILDEIMNTNGGDIGPLDEDLDRMDSFRKYSARSRYWLKS